MKIPTDSFTFKVVIKDGRKTIALSATQFYQHFLNTKTKEGDIGTLTITMKKPTRSEQQLRYYAVLVGLIADYTGDTWDEMHEALMILKWGTKKVKLGNKTVMVRKSISNRARFKKVDMMEQIEFTLEQASELGIVVPTKQELGYISN